MSLVISDVSKRYRKSVALDHFDAEFTNGVYGILGPNGAGKTTLINIIVGLIPCTSGNIIYNDSDVKKLGGAFLNEIGVLPQQPRFYRNYTAQEFLRYMATVKGMPKQCTAKRIDFLLETVNLTDERNKKVGAFSGGMRQRLGIAQAMLNDPSILILDEPTAGLDPMERIRFRNLISTLSENRIVILATHIVSDVEYISNEVVLIGRGKKLHQAKALDLMKGIDGCVWEAEIEEEAEVRNIMQRFSISNVIRRNGSYCLRIISDSKPTKSATSLSPTLEDVYLYFFGSRESG